MVGIDMLLHMEYPWVDLGWPRWGRVENKNSAAASHPVFSRYGENLCPATRLCEKDREVPESEIQIATKRMRQYLGR